MPGVFVAAPVRCGPRYDFHWLRNLLAHCALTFALVVMAGQGPARAQSPSPDPLLRDSFPIGSQEGALCQVQSALSDPATSSIFDRVWTIYCRDAALPVGRVLALRGDERAVMARVEERSADWRCAAPANPENGGIPVSQCSVRNELYPTIRYHQADGNTVFIGEGIAAYRDAINLAFESIRARRIVPGVIRVATTSVGDAAALARIQTASLPADRALAEGYRRNNSGDYAEAAVYFEALERRPADQRGGVDPSEFTLNRALQLSNLGDFAEAERLFAAVDAIPTADMVQRRLRRNFRAIHALNQGDQEGALILLDQPLPPLPALEVDGQAVAIPAPIAAALNAGSASAVSRQLSGDEQLTPLERAILIDAQALQLRGTVLRLTGQPDEARQAFQRTLTTAMAVRNGRVTSIIRLRAQTMGEIALAEEQAGRLDAARAQLDAAIRLLETEYPETLALAAARAKLAAFLSLHQQDEAAVLAYRSVVAGLTAQRRQLTGLYNQMAPYYRILVDRQASDPSAAGEFFTATQLLVRPGVADTQAVLARELSGGSGEAATLFRQANNLARDIERARIDVARIANGPQDGMSATRTAELETRIANLSSQQTATLTQLAQFPQYRAVSQDSLTLADLQQSLRPGEAYLKLTVVGDDVYGLFVNADTTRAWRSALDRAGLERAVDGLRSTISSFENGRYETFPYDAELAHRLYTELFGPVAADIARASHLIFEPDGAMLRLPPNVLITDAASIARYRQRADGPGGDPFDMRGIAWLGRQTRVSTAVSALAFRNTRQAPASRAQHSYLGLGNNAPVAAGSPVALSITRGSAGGSGAANDCSWPLAQWNRPIAATELINAKNRLDGRGADIVTGAAFTDRAIRARQDMGDYRILHFATHGLVTPPRTDCPARPALLTSFDSEDSDGLLSFDEIFGLRLDADLVILSACDTAGQASISATREAGVTSGGGSALDGLVRAFIGAGGRSILASHWPAPDSFDATQRLIDGLFEAPPGTDIATALGRAQDRLMDDPRTSHPYYWAGFAIIGDGAQPVIRPANVAVAVSVDGEVGA